MTDIQLAQVYKTPDGQEFSTKAAAMEHMRKPVIREAMMRLTENNAQLADFILENQDDVLGAFEIGQIKRVTKQNKKALEKAINAVVEKYSDDSDLKFLVQNAPDVVEGFRWPAQKRMSDEEKAVAVVKTLTELAGGQEEVGQWIAAHEEGVKEAFDAGKVKREVSPKAKEALERYQAKKRAEKEAAEKAAAAAG